MKAFSYTGDMSIKAMGCLFSTMLCAAAAVADEPSPRITSLETLGRTLFFDPRLSRSRTLSCATCHDPAMAFTDSRDNGVSGAVSLGDDGVTLGTRNAPTLTYAALVPTLKEHTDGSWTGGLFHDGRAVDLAEQASHPLLGAREMDLGDAATVLARITEDPVYVDAFAATHGPTALASPEHALIAVTSAIASFEASREFSTFDSRYDRYLAGEETLSHEEELGRILFFSPLSNCNQCHLLDAREGQPRELFSNFEYHNIGVPANLTVQSANGTESQRRDLGLAMNPRVTNSGHEGKVRVPTLRNVAVTAPYMHNGVFADLRTAIVFYNRFLVDNPQAQTNPETKEPWNAAEVPQTVALDLLADGQPLDEPRVRQLEAFLRTLTDRRYEHLLER